MADEHESSDGIPETVVFIVGLFVVLGAIWWIRGGPNAAKQPSGSVTQTATSTDQTSGATSIPSQYQY